MNRKWKDISILSVDAFGHYWSFDTNEGVVESFWDSDHRKMTDTKGNQLLAVTHFKDYYVPDNPITEEKQNISKGFIEYLINESDYKYTEIRLVVQPGGHCYSHVPGRSSETFDFDLPNEVQYKRAKKINKILAQDAYIDWTGF